MAKKSSSLLRHTNFRFVFSYMAVILVLVASFSVVFRQNVVERYHEEQKKQTMTRMERFSEQMDEELNYLRQLNDSITRNMRVVKYLYQPDPWNTYELSKELMAYDQSSAMVDSIIVTKTGSDSLITTKWPVSVTDGIFTFYNYAGTPFARFDPSPYKKIREDSLLLLSDGVDQVFVYFPGMTESTSERYTLFYLIDTNTVELSMLSLLSQETLAVAMIDPEGRLILGVGTEHLEPYLDRIGSENGFYELDSSNSLYVQPGYRDQFRLVTLVSNEFILEEINQALWHYLPVFLIMCVVGFFVMVLSLRLTLSPLKRLTKKISPGTGHHDNYFEVLNQSFARSREENLELEAKLDHYRVSVQKELLGSAFGSDISRLDRFFETSDGSEIFVVLFSCDGRQLDPDKILLDFASFFPEGSSLLPMECTEHRFTFLLDYAGQEPNKEVTLRDMVADYTKAPGMYAAISNSSHSILNAPSLYDNVITASLYWNEQHRTVSYTALHLTSSSPPYPTEKVTALSDSLKSGDFFAAKTLLTDILSAAEHTSASGNLLSRYFFRYVSVDVLTEIVRAMDASKIKFKDYSDLYFSILYACSSCASAEENRNISQKLLQLLDYYEMSMPSQIVDPERLRLFMEKSFCDPDFSISFLADQFHISIAYMSYLCKKNLGMNFIDYLWALRLDYAEKLLRETNLSVEDIARKVGYLNVNSFYRKFKQSMGITPAQYRRKEAGSVLKAE